MVQIKADQFEDEFAIPVGVLYGSQDGLWHYWKLCIIGMAGRWIKHCNGCPP